MYVNCILHLFNVFYMAMPLRSALFSFRTLPCHVFIWFFLIANFPLLVSHAIIWLVIFLVVSVYDLRDFWFNFSGTVLCFCYTVTSRGRLWGDWLEYFACFLPSVGSQVLRRFFFFTSPTVACWSIERFMRSLFVIFLLFTVNFSWLLQLFILSVRSYSRRRLILQG